MNWIDLIIIFVLLFFALEGIGKSFFGEFFDFLSFLFAFFLSLRFYNLASNFYISNFQIPHSFATVLGFISIWMIMEFLFLLLINFLIPFKSLTKLDRYLSSFSFAPSLLRGIVLIALVLILIGSFPIQPKIKQAVERSKIGSKVLNESRALEDPLKKIFGGISQDTLTFLTIKPSGEEKINLGFQTTDFSPSPKLENDMIDLVNNERQTRGLKVLKFDANLRAIARDHSSDMFTRGYFSHYSPDGKTVADRAEKAGIKYLVIGENLAYAPSLSLAHNGLMNSPGHRANILSPDFNKVGIGIMDGGVYGLMITQVFTN